MSRVQGAQGRIGGICRTDTAHEDEEVTGKMKRLRAKGGESQSVEGNAIDLTAPTEGQ